jgi:glycosyltransferase involved in cell wall biosynthesis
LTALKGFTKYLQENPLAQLHMIYQKEDLLQDIKKHLAQNEALRNSVHLRGKLPHEELPYWFSAADLFISASHKEGSGYALLEAMACGCIPVVTAIPSFKKITDEGRLGFLFEPGNSDSLHEALLKTRLADIDVLSEKIRKHFETALSFESIAGKLFNLSVNLMAK